MKLISEKEFQKNSKYKYRNLGRSKMLNRRRSITDDHLVPQLVDRVQTIKINQPRREHCLEVVKVGWITPPEKPRNRLWIWFREY